MTPLRNIPMDLALAAAVTGIAPEQLTALVKAGAGPSSLTPKSVATWVESGQAAKWQNQKLTEKKEELCQQPTART